MAPALLLVPAALASFILAFGTGVEFVRFTSLRPLLGGIPESGGPGLLPCAGTGRAPVPEVSSGSETLFPPSTPSVCGAADCAVGGPHLGHRSAPPGSSLYPLPGLGSWA
ncbi:nurim isoform X1 [Mus musculus]|nr:nurim isoform X1 [Mus musculus]